MNINFLLEITQILKIVYSHIINFMQINNYINFHLKNKDGFEVSQAKKVLFLVLQYFIKKTHSSIHPSCLVVYLQRPAVKARVWIYLFFMFPNE